MQGTRIGGVARLSIESPIWAPHLSCKRDYIEIDYMDKRGTPARKVTSPTWGPPPACEQALSRP